MIRGGNRRMSENHRFLRVDSRSQIIEKKIDDIILNVIRRVAVGYNLIIGDDDISVYAALLHCDPLFNRAEIMSQMQPAGRAIAGEHREFFRVLLKFCKGFVRTLFCRQEAGAHLISRCRNGCDIPLILFCFRTDRHATHPFVILLLNSYSIS